MGINGRYTQGVAVRLNDKATKWFTTNQQELNDVTMVIAKMDNVAIVTSTTGSDLPTNGEDFG